MIIASLEKGQGFGNQMWLYAATRMIAQKNGLEFSILNQELFKGKDFLNLDFGCQRVPNNMQYFKEIQYYDKELNYLSSGYDSRVEGLKSGTKIHGLFQDERYIQSKIFSYKNYFNEILLSVNIPKDACVMNIRGGEYKRISSFILSKEYWLKAIEYVKENYNINKFIIVTDDYQYSKYLFPNLHIISSSIQDCFSALYTANYVILSNSSFSYFPVNLSDKKLIIAPKYWARPNNRFGRWCSISNVYENWIYMDYYGKMTSYQDAINIRENTELHYKDNYNVLTCSEMVLKRNWFSYTPKFIKTFTKKFLKKALPKYIG